MFKTVKIVLAMIILAFSMVGCSTAGIVEGTVVGKNYHEAYTDSVLECARLGSDGFCNLWLPENRNVPESWSIQISDNNATDPEFATFHVTEEKFNNTSVGDYVNFGE